MSVGVPTVRVAGDDAQAFVSAYLDAFRGGTSIVVRSREPFENLSAAIDTVARMAPGQVLVTDLATHADLRDGGPNAGETDPSPVPLLAYSTSGSTGAPKFVVYQQDRVHAHARAIAEALRLTDDVTYVALPPIRFAYGLSIVNSHADARVPVTFLDAQWSLPGFAQAIAEGPRPVAVYMLPQHTPLLLSADIDPGRLERILIAGGRISGQSVRALHERFPRMRLTNMYGQAEMGPRLSIWDGDPAHFVEGTIGVPLPGVSLRVLEQESGDGGVENAGEEAGRLVARSDFAMWRWIAPPYDRAEDWPGDVIEQVTGDLGTVTPDGDIRHAGRGDHVLNVAGTKVDLRRVGRLIEDAFQPLIVRVAAKKARVTGDMIPVVDIVPAAGATLTVPMVRRTLHADLGPLAGLFDVHISERLSVGESGK